MMNATMQVAHRHWWVLLVRGFLAIPYVARRDGTGPALPGGHLGPGDGLRRGQRCLRLPWVYGAALGVKVRRPPLHHLRHYSIVHPGAGLLAVSRLIGTCAVVFAASLIIYPFEFDYARRTMPVSDDRSLKKALKGREGCAQGSFRHRSITQHNRERPFAPALRVLPHKKAVLFQRRQ